MPTLKNAGTKNIPKPHRNLNKYKIKRTKTHKCCNENTDPKLKRNI